MIRVIRGVLVASVALLAVGSTTAVRAFAGEEEGENAPGLLPQVATAKVSLLYAAAWTFDLYRTCSGGGGATGEFRVPTR